MGLEDISRGQSAVCLCVRTVVGADGLPPARPREPGVPGLSPLRQLDETEAVWPERFHGDALRAGPGPGETLFRVGRLCAAMGRNAGVSPPCGGLTPSKNGGKLPE